MRDRWGGRNIGECTSQRGYDSRKRGSRTRSATARNSPFVDGCSGSIYGSSRGPIQLMYILVPLLLALTGPPAHPNSTTIERHFHYPATALATRWEGDDATV